MNNTAMANPLLMQQEFNFEERKVYVKKGAHDKVELLIDQETGEKLGRRYSKAKQVDTALFVKHMKLGIPKCWSLSPAGMRTYFILTWVVQTYCHNKDTCEMTEHTYNDFLEQNPYVQFEDFSLRSFRRGVASLVEVGILASSDRRGIYFLDPHSIFNGDRMEVLHAYELNKELDKGFKGLKIA